MQPSASVHVQKRYNNMRAAFHASPFHMDAERQAVHEGSEPAVRTFTDAQQAAAKTQQKSKAALHQVWLAASFYPRHVNESGDCAVHSVIKLPDRSRDVVSARRACHAA